jgi:hypothetical protein
LFRIFTFSLLFVALIAGCAPQLKKPVQVYPGSKSVNDSLALLELRCENALPIKANGQCFLEYYANGQRHKENFPVKIWANPPSEIYLQGDVAFDPKGVVFGSNKDEFWLSVRLKEVSTYWWGQWQGETFLKGLTINPRLVLEAVGAAKINGGENWSLLKTDDFDVLVEKGGQNAVIRKMYIDKRNSQVRKIEYLGAESQPVIVAEMDRYKEAHKDFSVPTVINISRRSDNKENDLISIGFVIDSVKATRFTQKQRDVLFGRPSPESFKHIYKLDESSSLVEQSR